MNPDEFVEDFLAHFGVKGMKWGQRKAKRAANERNASADYKNFNATKTKAKTGGGTKALSNQELQSAITRMNLENQFTDLKRKQTKVAKGYALVKTIIGVGKTGTDAYNTGVSIGKVVTKRS